MSEQNNSNKGALIWITGLPGAGKSTLAKKVYTLFTKTRPTVLMDGDHFREIMGGDLGYSPDDRQKNAFRIARMNKYLVDHEITVICSTVSLYKEVHDWNREHIKNLYEVFIDVEDDILHERDQKGLYSKSIKGEVSDLVGKNQSYDIPENPHLIIKNNNDLEAFLSHASIIFDSLTSSL